MFIKKLKLKDNLLNHKRILNILKHPVQLLTPILVLQAWYDFLILFWTQKNLEPTLRYLLRLQAWKDIKVFI